MPSLTSPTTWGLLAALIGLTSILLTVIPLPPTLLASLPFTIPPSITITIPFLSPVLSQQPIHPLTAHLSTNAQLHLPTDPSYPHSTHRWSASPRQSPAPPSLVVLPATEEDIVATIQYANENGIPFLATSGGHGTTTYLSQFGSAGDGKKDEAPSGILINLRQLNSVALSADGATATVGGGILTHELITALWADNKQTTTGICSCVSFAGPALGGGHGLLQGQYGLAADQIVGMRVVLGNGEVVDLEDPALAKGEGKAEHEDLWWAMRGAGHNFGVVSEFRLKVHDVAEDRKMWAYEVFVFPGERLEEVFTVLKGLMEEQPAWVTHWTMWGDDPVNPTGKPGISSIVFYNGPLADSQAYTAPIQALKPVGYVSGSAEYPDVNAVVGTAKDSPICQAKGTVGLRAVDVDEYDLAGLRKAFDILEESIASDPALGASFAMLEGYSVQAVQAVPAERSAFPHRDLRLMLAPITFYDAVGNNTLDEAARTWTKKMAKALDPGPKPRSYVNYGYGDESLEAAYG
ncbi:hypothetical protein B0J18DRAFT_441854 [Chaetomium sp. MPI-SDFR-AT-0129]|nr:hypothetical protein B0J18DRAFT_441854 [Chaetomium sp. MPI-SDFR-AT-0129]